MSQHVNGMVARSKGEPVRIETIVVPDPGRGHRPLQDRHGRRVLRRERRVRDLGPDFAKAIIDGIENPKHHRTRFSVAY
ncbi:hypothetical protein ABZY09_39550 [Streptomyces sp. NPDC002928]|uniref:hypothetical protein n=1 Tax=Streptomyces sp. NPDC002928 TaxID=3154440 RepID=UPI0033A8FBAA